MPTRLEGENTELVIGLVAPIGTDLAAVKRILQDSIEGAGYRVHQIKVSEHVIPKIVNVNTTWASKAARYEELITAGNSARRMAREAGDRSEGDSDSIKFDGEPNAILAYGVAAEICRIGSGDSSDKENDSARRGPNFKTAYIIDSLKRPEEVDWLRSIYPGGFILIGVFESEADRRINLCGIATEKMSADEAGKLIEIDRNEEKEHHGQRVVNTFHLSDFFLHFKPTASERLKGDIERMVRMWFGDPFATPTFDEFAMYMAFSASLRTADLSRQVGAVVAKGDEILSTGANECPRPGGGLYWPTRLEAGNGCVTDVRCGRDYMRGSDSNAKAIESLINEVVALPSLRNANLDKSSFRTELERSTLADITEYGRVVHAEMEAILACARNTISTRDATLYCTTFPCHNCAKHIVAAGIIRVVYIEPYAKSRALDLHPDAIAAADPGSRSEGNGHFVQFEPFVGVGPRRFLELFSMKQGSGYNLIRKKENGDRVEWDIGKSSVRLKMKPASYLDSEDEAKQLFQAVITDDREDR